MKHSYYIYYRTAADVARIRAVVTAMQTALAEATGVAGRLLSRVDDRTTWMEVYADVADPERFERELTACVERFGVRALLQAGAERHVERFTAD
ncbi:MAG: DUF4936 family protein [Burkholderiales bacterium]